MSTETSVDVSRIQDEELLRKMWQDTEDFGKKKEIRSHMYKLREERLRNFYSSGSDTTSEHSQKVSSIHESNAKDLCGSIHADSLKDYSFSSLKSKEIRDSESPTKEIQYRIPDKIDGNQGWNITSTNEKIPGGYSTSQIAVTSGSEKIDGGVANYLAECAQNASITSEGDDKNYVKSFKTNSKNAVQQVAKREDDSGNFQSFSNFSNSSSKVVTHHQSSSQDAVDNSSFPSNFNDTVSKGVEYKTYITDVPAELKTNPNYVDGKTKVTTETRTLEDGTTVTTTRYETKYGAMDTSSQNYSTTSSNQKFVSKGTTDYDSKVNRTNISDSSKIIVQRVPNLEQTNITNVSNRKVQDKQNLTDSQTHTTKSIQVVIDRNEQNNFDETRENVSTETFKNDLLQKNLKNNEHITKTTITEKIVKSDDQGFAKKIENERVTSTKSEEIPRYIEIIPSKPENREIKTTVDKTEKNITIRKQNVPEQVDQEFVIRVTPTPSKPTQGDKPDQVITTIIRTVDDYNNKTDTNVHQVIEQINKRISVDVSPTHQAFARSLRAVSPDHDKKRGSNRSLKSSVSSLRSSKSPEKNVCDKKPHNRLTPERKYTTPSRETSPTKNTNFSPIANGAPKQVPRHPSRNRSTSPTSDAETNRTTNKKIQRTTTDVEEISIHKTGYKPTTNKPNKNLTDRSPTSPSKPFLRESPTKEKPQERQDRPFKRRDTYEERCKQILGITEKDSPKTDTIKNIRNVTRDVKITKELSRDKLIKSNSRSPEKTCKPTEDNLKPSPKRKTPTREDYPSQKRQVPDTETQVKRNPSKDNLNAPKKEINEPEITKKQVKPLCDGDDFPHLHKQRPTCSPTKKPKDLVDSDVEETHKIVKKDNPFKEYPPVDNDFYVKNVQVDENEAVTTIHQTTERKSPLKEPIDRNKKNLPTNEKPREKTEYVTKILTTEQTNTFTRPNKLDKKSPNKEDICKPKPTDETERFTKISTTEQKNTFTRPKKQDKKHPESEDVCRPKPDDGERDTKKNPNDFYHKNIRTDENRTTTTEFEIIDRKSPEREPLNKNKRPTSPNKKVDDVESFTITSTTQQRNTFTRPDKPDQRYPDNKDVCRPTPDDGERDTRDFYHTNIRTDENETITKKYEIIDRKSPGREPINKKPTLPNQRVDESERFTTTSTTEQKNTFTRPNKPHKKSPDSGDVCRPKPVDGERDTRKDTRDDYHKNVRTDEVETITTAFEVIDRKTPGREPINKNKRPTSPEKRVDETERFDKNSTTEYKNTFTRPSKPDKKSPDNENVCRPVDDERDTRKDTRDIYRKNVRTDEIETITKAFEIRDRKTPGREPINKNKRPISPDRRVDETERFNKTSTTEHRNTFTRPSKPDKKSPDNENVCRPVDDERDTRKDTRDVYSKNVRTDEIETITKAFEVIDRKTPGREPINKNKRPTSPEKRVDETERFDKTSTTEYRNTFTRPIKPDKKSPDNENVCRPKPERDTSDFYHKNIKTDENKITRTEFEIIDRSSPGRKPVDTSRFTPSSKKPETELLTKTRTTEQSNTFTRPKKTDRRSPSNEDVRTRKTVETTRKVSDDFYHKNIKIDDSESITTEFEIIDRRSPERKPVNKDRESPSKKPTSTNKKVDKKTFETVTVEQSNTFKRPNKPDKKSPSPFGDVCKPSGKKFDSDKKKPKTPRELIDDDTEDDHGFTETTDIVFSTTTTKDQRHSQKSPTRKSKKPKQQDSDDEESSTDDDAPTIKENIMVDYDESTEVRTIKKDSFVNVTNKTPLNKKPINAQPKHTNGKPAKPKSNGVRSNENLLFEDRKVVTQITEYTDSYCTPQKPDKQRERLPKSNLTEHQLNRKPINDKTYKKPVPERQSPLKQVTESKTVKNISNTKQITKTQIDKKSDSVDKRHVVTATINISPKPKPLQEKKIDKKTTTYKTVTKTEPINPSKVTQVNNKITTKTITHHVIPQTDKKITRTTSHKTIKTSHPTPVRGQSKPELLEHTYKNIETEKNRKNVITTKSITLDNSYEDENEVIINLQRSVSSRESTPNRICPRLIPNTEDTSVERFPDEITEPGETSKKPTRLADISIIESSNLIQNERRTDKVTLQQLGKKPRERDEVDRRYPNETDLNVPLQSYRPKSPKCENYSDDSVDESFTSVSDKISRFIETAENVQNYSNKTVIERPNVTQISDDIKTDDCLLSVSEKVNKFTAAQNTINLTNKSKPHYENQSPKRKPPLENVPREKSPSKHDLENQSFRQYRSDTNETRSKTDYQIEYLERKSPSRESPRRESPTRRDSLGRESPIRETIRRESPRREPLSQVFPRRDSPKRESPTRESPTRESLRRESPRREPQNQVFPRRNSPKRESPTRESPTRESLRKESPRREPLSQVFPRRDSPNRESPTRESIRRDSPRRDSPKQNSPLRDCPKQEFPRGKSPKQDVLYREPHGKLNPSLKDIYQQETNTTKFSSVKTSKFLIEDTQNKKPRQEQSPNREIIFKKTTKTPVPVKETPKSVYPSGKRDDSTIITECVQIEDENQTYTRKSTPMRQSPDQKSPSKTVSRKEIYEIKTSKPTEATPKSTRTLSSVGRLRNTESMKRAKELFENFSKTPTTETTVQKSTKPVSPNKLIKNDYDLKSTHLIMNKVKSTGQVSRKENTPHYMLPLDRRPDEDDLVCDKTPRQRSRSPKMSHPYGSSSEDIPHYMLPLDRAPEEHYNEKIVYDKTTRYRSKSPNRSYDRSSEDIPHYMLPLDRKPDEHVKTPRQRSRSPTTGQPYPKYSGNVPHYMLPLDRTPDEYDTDSLNKSSRQRSRSPSTGQPYSKYSGSIPHYMLPLDRTPDEHDIETVHRSRSPTTKQSYQSSEAVPHYMLPLDRTPDEHDDENRHRSRSPTSKQPYQSSGNIPHYMLPLDRTPDEHDNDNLIRSPIRSQSPTSVEKLKKTVNGHSEHVPHYMLPINKSPHENHHEKTRSRETTPKLSRGSTPDKHVPSYMKPLEKNVKSKKPTKSSILETETVQLNGVESVKITKFGVTLRRTSSGRKVISSNNTEISNENEIEKIFDLNILEFLLEQATTYDQRRRIRAQIRVAKQAFGSKVSLKGVDQKTLKSSQKVVTTCVDTSNRKTQIIKENSSKNLVVDRRSERVEKNKTENKPRQKSPEKGYDNQKVSTTRKITRTRDDVVETSQDKPSWVTQKPLKKASERVVKTSSSTRTKSETVKVSSYEGEPIDLITSSYGVGPTDENGRPLFGLKALRAQNTTDTTKVKGTVIRSHFHSENGQEPVGEVSVTKFSNQPSDFGENLDENGLVSVTTTQKFGSKGTPSYKTLIDNKYNPDSSCTSDSEIVKKSTTTKESRRGSVKELSKKYGETTVETVKSEKSGGYPKAGLILRSTFKDSKCDDDDRLESQENYETVEQETIRTSSSTDTFLTNKTRVSGVQDVITRMKNSDIEYETDESPEDKEAKSLLNKFIGSQVILSGMETVCSSSSPTVRTVKRTTTTTMTTSKEGEKPTTVTRTFVHPITEEELTTVWDEDTLKLLLERSTEYEERRIIRSRLRDVMAEQKVCDEINSKSKEGISEKVEETSQGTVIQGSVTTTQGVTTQQKTSVKPVSPFAKFRQLDKQNSINSPPGTPRTPTGSGPLFKFTDPELSRQASTVKERLLQWCQMKTKEYENVQLDNFSSSWADGLAFCALIHHFLPEAFDYHKLTPKERRHNFTLAFRVADEKADIMPLLDVDDMVATRKPDWKCVFTYVQTIYARFKNED